MKPTILVVDDDSAMRELLCNQLEDAGWRVRQAPDATAAMDQLRDLSVDVLLTDLRMPGPSGNDLCREVSATRPDVPVIVMTGFGSMSSAVEAVRAGAYDFLTKPFEFETLEVALERTLKHRRLGEEVRKLRRTCGPDAFEGLVGKSPPVERIYELVDRVAGTEASVLFVGESGTGKELLAQAIHRRSRRSDGPFVAFNCAAVPEALLESELFGHDKGAFTDARSARQGLLREANGGTVFLDEIGDMSPQIQPKLLRALQERRVRPIGRDGDVPIDVRIVAATHRDLKKAIAEGSFRADLYYRLAVVTIDVPPLRERGDDILLLAEYFLDEFASTTDRPTPSLSEAAEHVLRSYRWPGNVRELRNAIEHALAVCIDDRIQPEHLPRDVREDLPSGILRPAESASDTPEFLTLDAVEQRHIERVLRAVDNNKSRAARILGIDRKTLHARLRRYEPQD